MTTQTKVLIGESGAVIGDLSKMFTGQILGQANNRLYRQHRVYTQRLSLLPSTGATLAAPIKVYALSTKWPVMGALRAARAVYERAMKEERALHGTSRWHDFRISCDSVANTLSAFGHSRSSPPAMSPSALDQGEYDQSSIVCEDGNTRIFTTEISTGATQYNVFEEFEEMGSISSSPSTPEAGGYEQALPGLNDTNAANLLQQGNLPPYSEDNDPRFGTWVEVAQLYRDVSGHVLSTGFFEAPLGLILVKGYTPTQDIPFLLLEAKAGKYKGVDSTDIPAAKMG